MEIAAQELGMEIKWEGDGVKEVGYLGSNDVDKAPHAIVRVDPRYFRPTEVESLLGDASNAKEQLGWEPKISFGDMVKEMVNTDLKEAEKDYLCQREGFSTMKHHE